MPNTYSQIYLHIIFAVQFRQHLIPQKHKEELHKYFTGLISNRGSKMLAINCMPDHAHLFIGYKPTIPLPTLVKEIKVASNQFINRRRWVTGRFKWQEGYGVFSFSQSQIITVINYINQQEQHHKKRSFKDEYLSFLNKFGVDYKNEYLFDFK
jgi:putative transposase